VVFDLAVEKRIFIHGMDSLEQAISSLLHVCFVANMEYPNGSGMLCTFLQRWVAKLDENGTTARRSRKDQASKNDSSCKAFDKFFSEYAKKVFVLSAGQRKWEWQRAIVSLRSL